MEVSSQLHAPAALLPGKRAPAEQLTGHHGRSERGGEDENILPLTDIVF